MHGLSNEVERRDGRLAWAPPLVLSKWLVAASNGVRDEIDGARSLNMAPSPNMMGLSQHDWVCSVEIAFAELCHPPSSAQFVVEFIAFPPPLKDSERNMI